MTIKVLGGTPHHGGPGLCHSCKFSHVFRAAAESDVTVLCKASADHGFTAVRVTRPIVECSEYANKLEKSEWEMKQIAWILLSKGGKPIGFFHPRDARKKAKDEDIDPLEDE